MKPIFILSLPRSGSTLLQKMLAANSAVASVAEPWVLLPLAGITGDCAGRSYADYSTRLATKATKEFISELPGGMEAYRAGIRRMMTGFYQDLCLEEETYFLDKTPRYYLIIDFLFEVFPDARVIFLFRHPLDVLSSVITTFSRGRFASHHSHVDLFEGPHLLHDAHQRYADRAFTVRYEELVSEPEDSCRKLTGFLGLDYEPAMVTGYGGVEFRGSMGDQVGGRKYSKPDTGSVARWKTVLRSVVRKRFAKRYLDTLGEDVLSTFGVDHGALRDEIRGLRGTLRGSLRDSFWLTSSWLARRGAYNVVKEHLTLPDASIHKLG